MKKHVKSLILAQKLRRRSHDVAFKVLFAISTKLLMDYFVMKSILLKKRWTQTCMMQLPLYVKLAISVLIWRKMSTSLLRLSRKKRGSLLGSSNCFLMKLISAAISGSNAYRQSNKSMKTSRPNGRARQMAQPHRSGKGRDHLPAFSFVLPLSFLYSFPSPTAAGR